MHDLVYDGVSLWPACVVREVGFIENGPYSYRLWDGLRFMALDLSVRFNLVSSEVYSDLVHFWDVFSVQFLPLPLQCMGFCMGNAILTAKSSMYPPILISPDD